MCVSLSHFLSLHPISSYAKIHIPIISSVAEHQPTTWLAFFRDLHILIIAFPAGVWLCFRKLSDECVFGKKWALAFSLLVLSSTAISP